MATLTYVFALFLFSLRVLSVFSCDCAPGSFQQERTDAITEDWSYKRDVYTATVTDLYCKCLPVAESSERLRCIHVRGSDSGALVAANAQEFTCRAGDGFESLYYQSCDGVMKKTKLTATSVTESDTEPVTIDNTNKRNCGITTTVQDATNGERCALTQQPCFYSLTIKKVFKGKKQVGQVINSSGPDALTTCGDPRIQLTVGQTYLIGLGSICSRVQPWTPISEYSAAEIALIEKLQKTAPEVDTEQQEGAWQSEEEPEEEHGRYNDKGEWIGDKEKSEEDENERMIESLFQELNEDN